MELLQKVALRRDLVCLLHEKPYAGLNGSGKHTNWSLSTDDGMNLLEPGKTPHDNAQFLLFICALIKAVDLHADMVRRSAANSGNDHRLGGNEAPPAIISIFMGEELTDILEAIAEGKQAKTTAATNMKVGVDTLPHFPKDNADRNRTSPFAFTGNKFEFRMVPSSASISRPCIVLNTIVTEALDDFATRLEKSKDVNKETASIIRDTMRNHGKIIFNGNNYSEEWEKEAKKRGLLNISSTVDALKVFLGKKAVSIFEKYKVLSKEEIEARYEVYLGQYSKQINIEANAALDMVKSLYIPAVVQFTKELAESIEKLAAVNGPDEVQRDLLAKVSVLLKSAYRNTQKLENEREKASKISDTLKRGTAFRDKVLAVMTDLRENIDTLETLTPRRLWPVPTYADLLFNL
jgi:glutamine synthetase